MKKLIAVLVGLVIGVIGYGTYHFLLNETTYFMKKVYKDEV